MNDFENTKSGGLSPPTVSGTVKFSPAVIDDSVPQPGLNEQIVEGFTARDLEEERLIRSRSNSVASSCFDENQKFIDRVTRSRDTMELDFREISRRIYKIYRPPFHDLTPTGVFGIAMTYKVKYGCPAAEHWDVKLSTRDDSICCYQRTVRPGCGPGIFFYLNSTACYHCGDVSPEVTAKVQEITAIGDMMENLLEELNDDVEFATSLAKRFSVQRNWWRIAAKALLLKAQKNGMVAAKEAKKLATCSIPCVKPWFDKQLFCGFRVSMKIQNHTIYSRGFDFSRSSTSSGDDILCTVRQDAKFWNGEDLVFTPKGMAKVFFRKKSKSDEKWRWLMAKSMGMTLDAAYKFFANFTNDESIPDVVPASMGEQPHPISIVREERVEFITVSEKLPPVEDVKNHPPPPPLPQDFEERRGEGPWNGDLFLKEPGVTGVARRAAFMHTYPDWVRRVSRSAFREFSRDLTLRGDAVPTWSENNLIVNPLESFKPVGRLKRVNPGPSTNVHEELLSQIRNVNTKEREFRDPRKERVDRLGLHLGFVVR